MTAMPDLFRARWRSGQLVGEAKPTIVVEIQKGRYTHGNYTWDGDDVDARIHGETRKRPFRARWQAQSDWTEIPGVLTCQLQHDTEQRFTVASIQIENIGYTAKPSALGGVYHLIEQGYLSPFRGYNPATRPAKSRVKRNSWYDVLARKARVRVWQGYGEPERDDDGSILDESPNGGWTFNGLIDDIDEESSPTHIALTARMGAKLTDQHLFGWAKSRTVLDPVTFCDRLEADDIKAVGGGADASSERDGHPARFVADANHGTSWVSESHTAPDVTEWVEVRLPQGRYEDFILEPSYPNMEVYVGVYVRNRVPGASPTGGVEAPIPPKVDGEEVAEGWVHVGAGDVPGANGGWAYLRKFSRVNDTVIVNSLGHKIECGPDSVLRVGFRNLHRTSVGGIGGSAQYRAGAVRLKARQRKVSTDTSKKRWILVDDVSDMVKVVLRWAGYEEWEVEQTGVRLKGKFVVNRSNFLIDPIKKAEEQTGFLFFIADPDTGESHGVPIFRRNNAITAPDDIEEIKDTDLLTGLAVKISEEPLPYNIRIRGKEASTKDGGVMLGAEGTRRILCYYKPPWAREGRLAGVLKHVALTYNDLRSFDECLIAAYLTALNEALQAVTATAEIPGNPFFGLDEQVGVLDTNTGMNTRLWITTRNSEMQTGENASWKTTVGGSMIDTPDLVDLIAEMDSDMPDPKGVSDGSTYAVG